MIQVISLTRSLTLLLFLVSCFNSIKLKGQCREAIASTNGYTVVVSIQLTNIITYSPSCPWGYLYNVGLNYNLSFFGTPPSGGLFIAQGNFNCNGSQGFSFSLPLNGGSGSYTTTNYGYIPADNLNTYLTYPSCTVANITNSNCGGVNLFVDGPGITYVPVPCFSINPLPIELINFEASKIGESTLLTWETISEKDNDHFEVQKSTDALEWSVIAQIKGAGNSTFIKSYSHIDPNPESGLVYYRLKQVDFDKSFSFSPIVVAETELNSVKIGELKPIPTESNIYFNIDSPKNGNLACHILNETGTVVKTENITFSKGRTDANLNIENLSSGYYILQLKHSGIEVFKKIVKY